MTLRLIATRPADLLPHEVAPGIAAMMDQGLAVIKRTLEGKRD